MTPVWARDADGDSQRFTGDDIYSRAGRAHFAVSIAMVPDRAIPLGMRLRRPDETVALGDWILLAYKTTEEA